jgi:hypothetical protein
MHWILHHNGYIGNTNSVIINDMWSLSVVGENLTWTPIIVPSNGPSVIGTGNAVTINKEGDVIYYWAGQTVNPPTSPQVQSGNQLWKYFPLNNTWQLLNSNTPSTPQGSQIKFLEQWNRILLIPYLYNGDGDNNWSNLNYSAFQYDIDADQWIEDHIQDSQPTFRLWYTIALRNNTLLDGQVSIFFTYLFWKINLILLLRTNISFYSLMDNTMFKMAMIQHLIIL